MLAARFLCPRLYGYTTSTLLESMCIARKQLTDALYNRCMLDTCWLAGHFDAECESLPNFCTSCVLKSACNGQKYIMVRLILRLATRSAS